MHKMRTNKPHHHQHQCYYLVILIIRSGQLTFVPVFLSQAASWTIHSTVNNDGSQQ